MNAPEEAVLPEVTVAKYAYVPFGKSGVTQNLPLFSSKYDSSLFS